MNTLMHPATVDKGWRPALAGVCLGLLAPLGWVVLRYLILLLGGAPLSLWAGTFGYALANGETISLLLYMGLGTAAVFGAFGYHLGRSSQVLQNRARELDQLHRTVTEQKENYENRFVTLNNNLKNFHASNARMQHSSDRREVLQLAAENLHRILGYDRVNLLQLDPQGQALRFAASCGDPASEAIVGRAYPFDPSAGVLYRAVTENRSYLVEDLADYTGEFRLTPPWSELAPLRSRNFVLCPITVQGQAVGLLAVDNKLRRKPLNDTDLDTVQLFAAQVASSLGRIQLLAAVESLVGQLQQTFATIRANRQQFASLISSLRQGTAATTRTIEEIAGTAEEVRGIVDDTSSAAGEISHAVEEVSGNLDRLQQFMESSVAGMTEITATAREVEAHATRSHDTAEQVKTAAGDGAETVVRAFQGLQGISLAVDETASVIDALARKGDEIDRIIAIIQQVNQKTNLLSLNAAIIAAQAGEHGRSFTVVAEEIRNLSQETLQSAAGIEGLVTEIRQLTRQAVQHIGETRQLVDQDISFGQQTEQALQQILARSNESMVMTREIRKSTGEQVRSSHSITRSIEELGDMSTRLSQASREQALGIRRIVQSVEEIKQMSEEMAQATARQSAATRDVDGTVEQVETMAAHIFSTLEERQAESVRVIEQLEAVKGPTAAS